MLETVSISLRLFRFFIVLIVLCCDKFVVNMPFAFYSSIKSSTSECSYCECFAAGVYCVEPCSCQACFNKPIHEDTVLATRKQIESRNPLAFAPKVIRSSDSLAEAGVGIQICDL